VVRGAVRMIRQDPRKPALGDYFFTTLAIVALSGCVFYALYWLSHFSTFWVPLGVVGLYAANLALGPLLPRYTRRGRRIMSQVRGLRMHLTDPDPGTGDPAGLLVASPEGFEWLVP